MLHWLAEDLSAEDSRDGKTIQEEMLHLSGDSGSSYICVSLDTNTCWHSARGGAKA